MTDPLASSILRIFDPDGNTAGAGFLLAPDLAVTCAHVVTAAQSQPGQAVLLGQDGDAQRFSATVLEQGFSPAEQDDLAFLRLDGPGVGVHPVLLGASDTCGSHPYLLLGFPANPPYPQTWADGVLHGPVDLGVAERQPVLEMSGEGVLCGMSGAPVLDARTQRVVGMLAEFKDLEDVRRAYAVRAETILKASPQPLSLHPAFSTEQVLAQLLALLQDPSAGITLAGDARSSILLQGHGNSIVVNLHDVELTPTLERRLASRRDLRSYLLWLTVRPDFLKWERLFVPLQGHISLPLAYSEEIPNQQGPAQQRDFEITSALAEYDAFVILGSPGAGKTTTLQKIGFEQARHILAGRPERLPFFVRLARQEGRPADEFLEKEWSLDASASFADEFAAGRLLLLLDGINEMAQEGRGERLRAWMLLAEKAVQRGNQVIFTGRELDYSEQLDLPRILVKPLEAAQIQDYLARRGAAGLSDQIADPHNRLEELASNPFFLNLLVDAYQSGERGLSNRGRLLEWFANKCFLRERKASGEGSLPQECRERALSVLAFAMQRQGQGTTFKLALARAALPACVATRKGKDLIIDADELLDHARGATLLDPNPDLLPDIRFFHHLLQEYFAALELNQRFDGGEDLSYLWQAKRRVEEMPPAQVGQWAPLPLPPGTGWEETTLLAAGLRRDPAKLVAAVRPCYPVLAARCLDEAGLADITPLRLGGLHIRLETQAPALAAQLEACRSALLGEFYDPAIHLRARLPAGLALGRLGDPRLELREKDGLRFILPDLVPVPAGCYTTGSAKDDPEAYDYEKPAFQSVLPAFRIARRPVTNAEFACFIEAGGYREQRWWQSGLAKRWHHGKLAFPETAPGLGGASRQCQLHPRPDRSLARPAPIRKRRKSAGAPAAQPNPQIAPTAPLLGG